VLYVKCKCIIGISYTFTFTFSHLADAFFQSDLQKGEQSRLSAIRSVSAAISASDDSLSVDLLCSAKKSVSVVCGRPTTGIVKVVLCNPCVISFHFISFSHLEDAFIQSDLQKGEGHSERGRLQ